MERRFHWISAAIQRVFMYVRVCVRFFSHMGVHVFGVYARLRILKNHLISVTSSLFFCTGEFIGFQLQNGVLSREAHQSYVHILLVLDPTAGKVRCVCFV